MIAPFVELFRCEFEVGRSCAFSQSGAPVVTNQQLYGQ